MDIFYDKISYKAFFKLIKGKDSIFMNLIYDFWTPEEYKAFKEYLLTLGDNKYKIFQYGIIPNARGIIGVRMPVLRKLAKEILKGNWRSFLELCTTDTFEEIMIMGIVIGYSDITFLEYTHWIDNYSAYVNNWAICDAFCASLKGIYNYYDEFFRYTKELLASKNPWQIRIGLVIMINYYINDTYLSECLNLTDKIHMEHYYVKMAQAWLVSSAYMKYPKEAYTYLLNSNLENWTYNKSIQKICDSLKVPAQEKELVKALKRK